VPPENFQSSSTKHGFYPLYMHITILDVTCVNPCRPKAVCGADQQNDGKVTARGDYMRKQLRVSERQQQ